MAGSEDLAEVQLQAADVLAGVRLSGAAHWNQTADDWQLFVRHAHVMGYRSDRSDLVATAAALPLGGGAGWISMVLVDPAWQHRGLATTLVRRCCAHLQARRLTPCLDATPSGQAVYQRMGFGAGFESRRWAGELAATTPRTRLPADLRRADLRDLDAIARLDQQASGLDRRFLLQHFLQRSGAQAWLAAAPDGRPTGFAIVRAGRVAAQVGPVVAANARQALALLQAALLRVRGAVFIDVPTRCAEVAQWLEAQGLRVQRPFVRMALVDGALPQRLANGSDQLFAIAGPEFG